MLMWYPRARRTKATSTARPAQSQIVNGSAIPGRASSRSAFQPFSGKFVGLLKGHGSSRGGRPSRPYSSMPHTSTPEISKLSCRIMGFGACSSA